MYRDAPTHDLALHGAAEACFAACAYGQLAKTAKAVVAGELSALTHARVDRAIQRNPQVEPVAPAQPYGSS